MRRLQESDEAPLPSVTPLVTGRPAHEPIDVASGAEGPPKVSAPALRFDWADWLPYLEDQDVPEEQKRALIETLWSIVVAFVDLGWQLNPNPELCGEELDLKAILTAVDPGKGKEVE